MDGRRREPALPALPPGLQLHESTAPLPELRAARVRRLQLAKHAFGLDPAALVVDPQRVVPISQDDTSDGRLDAHDHYERIGARLRRLLGAAGPRPEFTKSKGCA